MVASLLLSEVKAQGKLLFQKSNQTSSLTRLNAEISDLNAITAKSNPLNTEIEIIRSVCAKDNK